MPIHDWNKTYAGAFHDLHVSWLVHLKTALNKGLLPAGYYAMGEQVIGGAVPDVLTHERRSASEPALPPLTHPGSSEPFQMPSATITAVAEAPRYPPRPRVIAIRHSSGDRLVAIIEIVSEGNKHDAASIGSLVEKTVVALSKGINVVLIDLHSPGQFDPQGIHNLVWTELGQEIVDLPADRRLQVVSYLSRGRVSSFIEPLKVGDRLPSAPLFLHPALVVRLPLEETYETAFGEMPEHLQRQLITP